MHGHAESLRQNLFILLHALKLAFAVLFLNEEIQTVCGAEQIVMMMHLKRDFRGLSGPSRSRTEPAQDHKSRKRPICRNTLIFGLVPPPHANKETAGNRTNRLPAADSDACPREQVFGGYRST